MLRQNSWMAQVKFLAFAEKERKATAKKMRREKKREKKKYYYMRNKWALVSCIFGVYKEQQCYQFVKVTIQ